MTNIFKTDADIWVIPVNCVGVLGAGLAKQFRDRRPKEAYKYYQYCEAKVLALGNPTFIRTSDKFPKCICLFPTKNHWREKSKLDSIELGLIQVRGNITYRIKEGLDEEPVSIAVPKLGCGLGGLNWSDVKPLIERELGEFDLKLME